MFSKNAFSQVCKTNYENWCPFVDVHLCDESFSTIQPSIRDPCESRHKEKLGLSNWGQLMTVRSIPRKSRTKNTSLELMGLHVFHALFKILKPSSVHQFILRLSTKEMINKFMRATVKIHYHSSYLAAGDSILNFPQLWSKIKFNQNHQ